MCKWLHIPANSHRGQRRTSGVLLYHPLPYSLRQGLSLNLELGWQPSSPGNPPISTCHNSEDIDTYVQPCAAFDLGAEDLNSGPCACISY